MLGKAYGMTQSSYPLPPIKTISFAELSLTVESLLMESEFTFVPNPRNANTNAVPGGGGGLDVVDDDVEVDLVMDDV